MLHEKNARREKCTLEIAKHENSGTWKKCNRKKVQHEKNATQKKCTLEIAKHEKSIQHGKSAA